MASVFTFDSDPPRLSSPWPPLTAANGQARRGSESDVPTPVLELSDCGITRLESEPQAGPTEYKLHLLLRPRRSFVASSTLQTASGPHQSKYGSVRLDSQSELNPMRPSPSPKPSSQSRQNRLHNLTTQLLWRLQQSSPYHSSSRSGLVVPVLPQHRIESAVANGPESLLPGLEESQGALYEIGVSDDGALVGLTEDELEESLTTLRAMAFSLGCKVEVLRKVIVGDCRWVDEAPPTKGSARIVHQDNLLVAEALVRPSFDVGKQANAPRSLLLDNARATEIPPGVADDPIAQVESQTEQLRISLTGSSTSGKSSLLGTLSTSTLDNGRGKSRLSLLKHRHEIVSGISSSVTPELIGYQDSTLDGVGGVTSCTTAINYASGKVSSWNDIDSASEPWRLVLVTGSAGHPRCRRPMMRGLISWAPHWTVCCMAADGDRDHETRASSAACSRGILGSAADGGEGSRTHLDLCLKLGVPLVVVITKLDLASKAGLRQTLNRILSTLKAAGRRTHILPTTTLPDQDALPQSLRVDDEDVVERVITSSCKVDIRLLVPIVLTSAVNGTGIGHMHALLRHLPVFNPEHKGQRQNADGSIVPNVLFHVDEVFTRSENDSQSNSPHLRSGSGTVLSGYLRYGAVSVGDRLLVGPCTVDASMEGASSKIETHRVGSSSGVLQYGGGDLRDLNRNDRPRSEEDGTGDFTKSCMTPVWRKVRVESLRNLRLPVRKLLAGQVGTVGISWGHGETAVDALGSMEPRSRLRKRMVMINSPPPRAADDHHHQPPASYSGFCASFDTNNTIPSLVKRGSMVIVYTASIRTATKIVSISISSPRPWTAAGPSRDGRSSRAGSDDDDDKEIEEEADDDDDDVKSDDEGGVAVLDLSSSSSSSSSSLSSPKNHQHQKVQFCFLTSREWIELGTMVFVVIPEGGSRSGSGSGRKDRGTGRGREGNGNGSGSGGSGDHRRGNAGAGAGAGAGASAGLDGFVGTVTDVFD